MIKVEGFVDGKLPMKAMALICVHSGTSLMHCQLPEPHELIVQLEYCSNKCMFY